MLLHSFKVSITNVCVSNQLWRAFCWADAFLLGFLQLWHSPKRVLQRLDNKMRTNGSVAILIHLQHLFPYFFFRFLHFSAKLTYKFSFIHFLQSRIRNLIYHLDFVFCLVLLTLEHEKYPFCDSYSLQWYIHSFTFFLLRFVFLVWFSDFVFLAKILSQNVHIVSFFFLVSNNGINWFCSCGFFVIRIFLHFLHLIVKASNFHFCSSCECCVPCAKI